jgi:hypothetical protein
VSRGTRRPLAETSDSVPTPYRVFHYKTPCSVLEQSLVPHPTASTPLAREGNQKGKVEGGFMSGWSPSAASVPQHHLEPRNTDASSDATALSRLRHKRL